MRLIKNLCLIVIVANLAGCAVPASQQLLPEISYQQPVNVHSQQAATLVWMTGYVVAASQTRSDIYTNDPIANIVTAEIIADQNRHPNPKYRYQFGQYRQASFMRSLHKALIQHHVFKTIKLAPYVKLSKKFPVAIVVNFVSTKVAGAYKNHQVTLDVHLKIVDNKRVFKRVFFIQSKVDLKTKTDKPFEAQQIYAAKALMHKIMLTIAQWIKAKPNN